MIEYDLIASALKDIRRRLDLLIRASDDDVEVAHLYRVKHHTFEAEDPLKWARECHDNPRVTVEI